MIRNISEILKSFFEYEQNEIKKFNMPHMPTLGDAYEQITIQGLNEKILPDLNGLRVVSGFIKIGDKQLAQQIDCMLVFGEGEQFGLTDQYFYDIKNILAIFEVKKNLTKSVLEEALGHLSEIKISIYEYIDDVLEKEEFNKYFNHFSLHLSYLMGYRFNNFEELKKLPQEDFKLAQMLLTEMIMPVTIVHAYEGYKTISGLRNALESIINEVHDVNPTRGFRALDFPTLITTTNGGVLKTTGLPYWCTLHGKNNSWAYMCSFTENPAHILVEMLWAKIEIALEVEFPYGDDLIKENLYPLLEIKKINKKWGGEFIPYNINVLGNFKEPTSDFHPDRIDENYAQCLNLIFMMGGAFDMNQLSEYLSSKGIALKDFIDNIRLLNFVGVRANTINLTNSWLGAKVGNEFFVSSEIQRFRAWLNQQESHEIIYNNFYFNE